MNEEEYFENHEEPKLRLSKEEKKLYDQVHYMGGGGPLHFTVLELTNRCRIDFISAAHPTDLTADIGTQIYAIIKKNQIPGMIKALQRTYENLKD